MPAAAEAAAAPVGMGREALMLEPEELRSHETSSAGDEEEGVWADFASTVEARSHEAAMPAWAAVQDVRQRSNGRLDGSHFVVVCGLSSSGSGGAGRVDLVELAGTGQRYALKRVSKRLAEERGTARCASTERRILARLDHPFFPTLYASFETEDEACLVLGFCRGGNLVHHMRQQPSQHFSEASARFYAAEVLLALEYLHCQGIIYRNLKPANVLLGSSGHVVLVDFSLALATASFPTLVPSPVVARKPLWRRVASRKSPRPQAPQLVSQPRSESDLKGVTEAYLAPESIIGGSHGQSSAIDWWAFGILLYEMLFGKPPFHGTSRHETTRRILADELAFPAEPTVSAEARSLLQALLEKEPGRRIGSAHGANDVRAHPFFRAINWALIRSKAPPKLEVVIGSEAIEAALVAPRLDIGSTASPPGTSHLSSSQSSSGRSFWSSSSSPLLSSQSLAPPQALHTARGSSSSSEDGVDNDSSYDDGYEDTSCGSDGYEGVLQMAAALKELAASATPGGCSPVPRITPLKFSFSQKPINASKSSPVD